MRISRKTLGALALLLTLGATCAQAQVTFDAKGTADCTSNGVTTKDCATLTVGSGSNRALVVLVAWSSQSVTSPTWTWDNGGTNQAMSLVAGPINTPGTNGTAAIYGLVAPTSGAKTLHGAWTGTSDVTVIGVAYTGVDQTGGTTTFAHAGTNTGTAASFNSGTTNTITITSATNNATLESSVADGASYTTTTQTSVYTDNAPAGMSAAGSRAVGAATVTHTWTQNSGGGVTLHWATAGIDVVASGAAAACTPTLSLIGVGRCG